MQNAMDWNNLKISKRMYCIQHYTYDDTANNNQKKDRKKKKRVHRVI